MSGGEGSHLHAVEQERPVHSRPGGQGNPRRYAVMNQTSRFGNYCQMFGKGGWLKCHEERLMQKAEKA